MSNEQQPLSPDAIGRELDGVELELRQRRRRLWRNALLLLLFVLLLLCAALPRIASLPQVRTLITEAINLRLAPSELTVDAWRLRWFGKQSINRLTLSGFDALEQASIEQITIEGGLLALLPLGKVDLGHVHLSRPEVQLRLPEAPAEASAPHKSPAREDRRPPVTPPPTAPPPAPRRLPITDLACHLQLDDGRLTLLTPSRPPLHLTGVQTTLHLPSLRLPADWSLQLQQPAGGTLTATGTVAQLAALLTQPETLVAEAAIKLQAGALAPLAAPLAAAAQLSALEGLLDGEVALQVKTLDLVTCRATLQADKLHLVRTDSTQPPLPPARLTLDLQGELRRGRLHLPQLQLNSPWLNVGGHAALALPDPLASDPEGNAALQLQADLAAIRRDWGDLLQLPESLEVTAGQLRGTAEVKHDNRGMLLQASLVATNLHATHAGELLVATPPPRAELQLRRTFGGLWELLHGEVQTSFATLHGQGTAQRGELAGRVDLTRVTRDLRPVIPRLPRMIGAIELTANTRELATGGSKRLESRIKLYEVAVAAAPDTPPWVLDSGDLQLAASFTTPTTGAAWQRRLDDITFNFTAPPGSLKLQCDQATLPGGNSRDWLCRNATFESDFDLAATRRLLRPLLQLPPTLTTTGRLLLSGKGEVAAGRVDCAGETAMQELLLTLATASGEKLRLTNRQAAPRPFSFTAALPAAPADLLKSATGKLSLHLASLESCGIQTAPGDLHLTLANGTAQLAYAPPLKSGSMALAASLDLTSDSPQLHLPTNGVALSDIPLEASLLELLRYLNPLLGASTALGGTAALQLGPAATPLNRTALNRADFDVALTLDDAVLMPTGVLARLLAHTGAADKPLTIDHAQLTAACRNGIIAIEPHQALIRRKYPLIFSGNVSLDQNIAFNVELPLTSDLAGDKAASLTKTSLNVPVNGTLSRPVVDFDSVARQIREIMASTAREKLEERADKVIEKVTDRIEKLRKKIK